jgi:hypothetical protein
MMHDLEPLPISVDPFVLRARSVIDDDDVNVGDIVIATDTGLCSLQFGPSVPSPPLSIDHSIVALSTSKIDDMTVRTFEEPLPLCACPSSGVLRVLNVWDVNDPIKLAAHDVFVQQASTKPLSIDKNTIGAPGGVSTVYHGLPLSLLPSILANGIDVTRAGSVNGAVCGKGFYTTDRFLLAARYATKEHTPRVSYGAVIQCRVMTGVSAIGRPTYTPTHLPAYQSTPNYVNVDSTVDKLTSPTMFVSYQHDAVLIERVIIFARHHVNVSMCADVACNTLHPLETLYPSYKTSIETYNKQIALSRAVAKQRQQQQQQQAAVVVAPPVLLLPTNRRRSMSSSSSASSSSSKRQKPDRMTHPTYSETRVFLKAVIDRVLDAPKHRPTDTSVAHYYVYGQNVSNPSSSRVRGTRAIPVVRVVSVGVVRADFVKSYYPEKSSSTFEHTLTGKDDLVKLRPGGKGQTQSIITWAGLAKLLLF